MGLCRIQVKDFMNVIALLTVATIVDDQRSGGRVRLRRIAMSLAGNVSSKFSLYDQVGYLLVGSVLLLLAAFDIWLLTGVDLTAFELQAALVLIVVAYLLGHIVQAVANIVIKEKKDEYSDTQKGTLQEVREYFGFPDWNDREAFQHCYILVCARDVAGHVAAFNAYYSLYRGWFLLCS
ncbi:MAG: hypothetical protein J7J98_02990 [candidate division Zixibacteria bacterium]|nr:hypothetical protein [candidate division Zixibacteria bacterium]